MDDAVNRLTTTRADLGAQVCVFVCVCVCVRACVCVCVLHIRTGFCLCVMCLFGVVNPNMKGSAYTR